MTDALLTVEEMLSTLAHLDETIERIERGLDALAELQS